MANEIKFYLSGGTSNTNPFLSNGGTISNTEIVSGLLNNLWPDVSETDSFNGLTDHKVIFVKNVSGGALTAVRAYFGELDQFTGMSILTTTNKNSAVDTLALATDAVVSYFLIWQNISETHTTTVSLNNINKRIVLKIDNVKHQVYNQYPDKIDILMSKTGAPTGTATVKVWAQTPGSTPSAADNTVIRTLGTIDVSTLTTTMTSHTFNTVTDLITNPLPSAGWRIGIEYTAGTATAHVDIAANTPTTSTAVDAINAAQTQMWASTTVIRTDSDLRNTNTTVLLIIDEVIEALADIAVGKGYGDGSNFVEQLGYIDTARENTDGGEICDVCESHANAIETTFSDGLTVPYYWDTVTKKCVSPGAASAESIPTPSPNIINHGAAAPPSPKIVLIFWGPWTGASASYKDTVIDFIQNGILDTHKNWWNTGMTDYKFGMPTWGQAVVYNRDLPANTANYRTTEMANALDNAINNGAVTHPITSMFQSQATNVSNYFYVIIPDQTWTINSSDADSFGAFHTGRLYSTTQTPPPDPGGLPGQPPPLTQPVSYQGGFLQTWDGTKWVDSTTTQPYFNIYTNTGPCFQTGNPPPPGGGTPPPGGCSSAQPPQGTLPVAGGGGGAEIHGFPITAATDNGNDGNVAANAIDHNLATRWSQNGTTAQLTLDMGQNRNVSHVKIAWFKGDERQAKFNISHSTDNVTYTTVVAGTGASFMSSGTSLALEEFSFVQQGGLTAVAADGTAVSITLEVPWLAMQTGDNPGGTTAAFIVRDLADELLECITNPITNGAGADKGWMDSGGFEICDLCENHSNATTANFSDGLSVPYYWDTGTKKCVAPGAASGGVSISENPTYTNHGGHVIGSPQVYLIFWGPTWTSQATFKTAVTSLVQTKLLGTDASAFFATAKTDYNFNTPTWGGAATNTSSPANTSSYTSADVMVAIQQAITAGSVPNPATSSFTTSQGQRCSNTIYAVIPDLSWHALVNDTDNSIAEAIHLSMTYTTSVSDPNPPPPNPPPVVIPPPTPTPPPGGSTTAFTARYVRYLGLGNTVNTWNSVTEMEIYGDESGGTTPTPPPPGGSNPSQPSSYDTGIALPDLNNNDFVALHLERIIPPRSNHVELENYSIVISNEPHPLPPSDEPIPGLPGGPGGGGPGGDPNLPPIGEIPLPSPPGVFDPGTIPPPEPIPEPPPGGIPCPGPPDQPPPVPDPGGGTPPPGGGGGGGTTPDGIKLVELPAGYVYADQHTNFHENFQSNGSFRLDVGVQPQLNELNLTFSLNLSSGSDEISSKLSGGTHTDSKPKNGRCYDIGINQAGDRVRIRKEDPHPKYHDGPSHSIHLGSLNGKWVYVQSLKWNEGPNVHLQCWIDTSGATAPTNQFVKILDDIDTGGWFESPYLTVFQASDSQTTIRVDSMSTSKFHYKFLCATRIQKTS